MNRLDKKIASRAGRKIHVRKRVSGTAIVPRLSVFKSNARLYIQAIDDVAGHTLAAASTLEGDLKGFKPTIETGKKLGALIGSRLKEKGVATVVFDRNGYKYHGVVKAIADATRETGIRF